MKIIIDAMGGDHAPDCNVQGAIEAQKEFGVDIVLVGQQEVLEAKLKECGGEGNPHITIQNATEVIDMHDDPAMAVRRKKDSSMTVALNMVKSGEGDAVVSAGSTGALLSGATLLVKRVKGIRRAAFAPICPNGGKGAIIIDCGANVECTSEYLLQFAYLGSFYAKSVMGIAEPKVGLLCNGAEDSKGTDLIKETNALLRKAGEDGRLNFIGNIEGTDVFSGKVDVIVCDGFSGNILLKTIEGTAKFLMKNIKSAMTESLKTKIGALLVKKGVYKIKTMMDPNEVGGTPFLGITKPVIKAHGSSNARAIRSAVMQAIAVVNGDLTGEIERNIEFMKLSSDEN